MAKKKAAAVDPLALVAAAAKKPTTKAKKKGTPIVEVKDPAVLKALESWKEHKQKEKTAKSNRELAEAILLPVCMEARRELIQRDGAHTSSVKVNGEVTLKTNKRYSKVPTESAAELEEVFGEDGYERLFHVHTDIKLSERAAQDPEVLQKLIEAVGAENFQSIFDVEQYIAPNDILVTERDLVPQVAEQHDEAVDAV